MVSRFLRFFGFQAFPKLETDFSHKNFMKKVMVTNGIVVFLHFAAEWSEVTFENVVFQQIFQLLKIGHF